MLGLVIKVEEWKFSPIVYCSIVAFGRDMSKL
jgi:hypothetical protein